MMWISSGAIMIFRGWARRRATGRVSAMFCVWRSVTMDLMYWRTATELTCARCRCLRSACTGTIRVPVFCRRFLTKIFTTQWIRSWRRRCTRRSRCYSIRKRGRSSSAIRSTGWKSGYFCQRFVMTAARSRSMEKSIRCAT